VTPGRPQQPRMEDEPLPHWQAWTAPVALISAFAIAIVGGLVIGAISTAFGASIAHPPPAVNLLSTLVQDGAFIACALIFARTTDRLRPGFFGLRRTPLWPAVGWVALAAVGFYLLSGLWAQLVNIKQTDQLPSDLGTKDSVVALIAVCVLVTVIAPIAEEFLFRGFFFTALRRWRGPWPAAVITGLVFGAIHAGSAPAAFLVPLALLGFLLCIVRWRTGSLLPCVALHSLNNAIAFGANEANWNVWQTILLMIAAVAAVLLVLRPFLEPQTRPV
jgi:membrane protease YdiL (CAAX protease family)